MERNPLSSRAIQHKSMCIGRMHRKAIENQLHNIGVHKSQNMILMHLYNSDSELSQKDIAKHFEISPAAVAVSLKKLEYGGYIERNLNKDDNRFNKISITEKGKEVVLYSRKVFEETDEKAFLGITDEERATLTALLDKVILNLKDISGKEE